jgi:drug/metabolite transporter (DMT)-like permease
VTGAAAVAPAPRRAFAVAAMVLSAACWGLATVASKHALDAVPPFGLLAAQLSASVAALWLAVALTGRRPRLDAAGRRAAATGLLEPGLAYGVGVPGLALTSASAASVIGAAEPALILLIGWAALGQRPTPGLWAAMAAAMAGVLTVTAAGAEDAGRSTAGDLMIFAGVAFAAVYVVASSRLATRLDPLPLAALQQSAGLALALALFGAAWATGAEPGLLGLPPAALALAAGTGVVQYALAFWLYLSGLRTLPAGVAGLFMTLIPVFGVGGAVAFLGETPTPAQGAGSVVVVLAVFAIARSRA